MGVFEFALALQEEMEILSKDSLEVVSDSESAFYSGLLEIASRGWKPVFDLPPFNAYVTRNKIHLETAASVVASIRKRDVVFSADVKDMYFQILIHLELRCHQFHLKEVAY